MAFPVKVATPVKDTPAKPADLAKAQHGPGTSTSTGGATAHRNTGAATGGAVTITISGSSSTGTSTETATETGGAGKGSAAGGKGKGAAGKGGAGMKPDTGDKRPHTYNITVNSTGQSGHAVDGAMSDPKKALAKGLTGMKSPGKSLAKKK